jgi:uncharacterized protein
LPENNSLEPVHASSRVAIIDILRGWALLGVVIINYTVFLGLSKNPGAYHNDVTAKAVHAFLNLVFVSKSWTLLSFLFGYGFAVLIRNLQNKALNPVPFFLRRMWWLFVLALINSALFFGDILKDYALMGIILLFFNKLSGKATLVIAVLLLAIVPVANAVVSRIFPASDHMASLLPMLRSSNIIDVVTFHLKATYYQEVIQPNYAITIHLMMFACGLFGFSAFKFDLFSRIQKKPGLLKSIFWYSLAAKVALTIAVYLLNKIKLDVIHYYNPQYLGVAATVICIVSGIYWLFLWGKADRIMKYLEAIGRMTLTNYIVQNIVSLLIFSGAGFAVLNAHHPAFYVGIALLVYVVQALFSRWWLSRYQFGPIEWIWRQLCYQKHLPLRKSGAS